MKKEDHIRFMNEALKEAEKGLKERGILIGSILVYKNKTIGRGHNRRVQKSDVIEHAEMNCLENAGRKNEKYFKDSILYTTLSPCDMCSGAILLYKIPTVIIGENSTFKGNESYLKKRGVKIINLNMKSCKDIMKSFIKNNSKLWNEDIGR
jgi:cytosine deaminase